MAVAFSRLFTSMVRGNLAEKRERHKTERSGPDFSPPPITRKKLLPFFSVFPLCSGSAIVIPLNDAAVRCGPLSAGEGRGG